MEGSNIKQTFSISLPAHLYEQLLKEIGRGNISRFVREIVEKELKKTDKQALRRDYWALENCLSYQAEAEEWENANLENGREKH